MKQLHHGAAYHRDLHEKPGNVLPSEAFSAGFVSCSECCSNYRFLASPPPVGAAALATRPRDESLSLEHASIGPVPGETDPPLLAYGDSNSGSVGGNAVPGGAHDRGLAALRVWRPQRHKR